MHVEGRAYITLSLFLASCCLKKLKAESCTVGACVACFCSLSPRAARTKLHHSGFTDPVCAFLQLVFDGYSGQNCSFECSPRNMKWLCCRDLWGGGDS